MVVNMTPSPFIINFIKHFEGFKPTTYLDAGHPCIGYGCDLSPAEAAAYEGRTITEDEASALLAERVKATSTMVSRLVHMPLNQNQFDALISLVYNIGIGAFGSSTILKLINTGKYKDAAVQFGHWVYQDKVINPGLVDRRKEEAALWLSHLSSGIADP